MEFNIESLKNAEKCYDVLWLHKLLNSQIDYPKLISTTPLNVTHINIVYQNHFTLQPSANYNL